MDRGGERSSPLPVLPQTPKSTEFGGEVHRDPNDGQPRRCSTKNLTNFYSSGFYISKETCNACEYEEHRSSESLINTISKSLMEVRFSGDLAGSQPAPLFLLDQRGGRRQRQQQIKGAAGEVNFITPGAFHPDLAAVSTRHAAHQRQPQTGSAAFEGGLA
jgi:hypothetical protein